MATTTTKTTKRLVNLNTILLENNLIKVIGGNTKLPIETLGTIVANFAYYGFALSKQCLDELSTASYSQVTKWWNDIKSALEEVTGDNRNMSSFVVYKNFPYEVLNKSEAEYWVAQIFMYLGVPNEFFTEDEQTREKLAEITDLKILHFSEYLGELKIFNNLLSQKSRWTEHQWDIVEHFLKVQRQTIDLSSINFKENKIKVAKELFKLNIPFDMKIATDVLLLCVALSDGDITLVEKVKFRNFTRMEREFILFHLEHSTNLLEDISRNEALFKNLFRGLHPGDYKNKFPKVSEAYNLFYNNKYKNYSATVEDLLSKSDAKVFELLKSRPGEFVRMLNRTIQIFGMVAIHNFIEVLHKLSVIQLLKVKGHFSTINERKYRLFAPQGNWTKLQIVQNDISIKEGHQELLLHNINLELRSKIGNKISISQLDVRTKDIKLQTNDNELSDYGRGTVFYIPSNIKFIRTASFWQAKTGYNVWYDNGWNFFDSDWNTMGTCCWDIINFNNGSAIFSGDPTNSKDLEGKACQMIDLYLDKLKNAGVRYAVWNILAYNRIPFNNAEEVFASLQWGEEEQKGKLFEPSRCQLSFPLSGKSLTKYIAYIDIRENKLVYLDANLYGNVRSASSNGIILQEKMPAFVEYLNTLPSVYDLFNNVKQVDNGVPILYNDKNIQLKNNEPAYVFKPVNQNNSYTQINLNEFLK